MSLDHAVESATPTSRQWQAWARRELALAELNPTALHRELTTPDQDRQDTLLRVLVRLAQRGPHPDVAVLVVVRGLLAGIRHRVGRYVGRLDRDDAVSILVAGVVENIARYDLTARPRFVANHLLSMPTGRLRRAAGTERAWASHRRDIPDGLDAGPAATLQDCDSPVVELLDLAVDAGTIEASDAWLIHSTRVDGMPLRHAATQLGIGYDAARKRRQRAEHRCATWWTAGIPPTTEVAA